MERAHMKLTKKDLTKTQGSWLGTIHDDAGKVIAETWKASSQELDEWFADRMMAATFKAADKMPEGESKPKTKEEADAIEAAGGSPSSLTWPPKPPTE